jgi:hypothetical protein
LFQARRAQEWTYRVKGTVVEPDGLMTVTVTWYAPTEVTVPVIRLPLLMDRPGGRPAAV